MALPTFPHRHSSKVRCLCFSCSNTSKNNVLLVSKFEALKGVNFYKFLSIAPWRLRRGHSRHAHGSADSENRPRKWKRSPLCWGRPSRTKELNRWRASSQRSFVWRVGACGPRRKAQRGQSQTAGLRRELVLGLQRASHCRGWSECGSRCLKP